LTSVTQAWAGALTILIMAVTEIRLSRLPLIQTLFSIL